MHETDVFVNYYNIDMRVPYYSCILILLLSEHISNIVWKISRLPKLTQSTIGDVSYLKIAEEGVSATLNIGLLSCVYF